MNNFRSFSSTEYQNCFKNKLIKCIIRTVRIIIFYFLPKHKNKRQGKIVIKLSENIMIFNTYDY